MIRKLSEKDRGQVLDYLQEEASLNLFLIGDIEHFGFETDFQELWGDFEEDGSLRGVLLRYDLSYLPYAKGEFDVEGFASIIRSDPKAEMVSAQQRIADQLERLVPFKVKKDMRFAELKDGSSLRERASVHPGLRKGTVEDVDGILELRGQIAEFTTLSTARSSMIRNLTSGAMRNYLIEDGAQILATASTTAENTQSAMVVGVCTHPDHRSKGYASQCMEKLCREVLKEGKTLCLFYENPLAGAIYHRLGFRDIGVWSLCYV